MSDQQEAKQATPPETLLAELLDSRVPKSEREHAAKREIERLRADLETERMRLAACGVAALANTADSAARARDIRPEYRSASLDDVERAVNREIQLRDERDELAKAFLALHATVVGECPSLLDEDSGGSSSLIELVADALARIEKDHPE